MTSHFFFSTSVVYCIWHTHAWLKGACSHLLISNGYNNILGAVFIYISHFTRIKIEQANWNDKCIIMYLKQNLIASIKYVQTQFIYVDICVGAREREKLQQIHNNSSAYLWWYFRYSRVTNGWDFPKYEKNFSPHFSLSVFYIVVL